MKMANPFVKKQSTLQMKLLRSNGVEVNLQLRAPLKAGGGGAFFYHKFLQETLKLIHEVISENDNVVQ